MNCSHCNGILTDELAKIIYAKSQSENKPAPKLECDACNVRLYARLKRLYHALTCSTCWRYHNLQFVNPLWFMCPTCQVKAEKYWFPEPGDDYGVGLTIQEVVCARCRFALKFHPMSWW